MTKKVIVLGGSGMLGSMIVDLLSHNTNIETTATVRNKKLAKKGGIVNPNVDWQLFNACNPEMEKKISSLIKGYDWIINAIGITKPLIHDDNPTEVEQAIFINSLLPFYITRKAQKFGSHVIQIATDCVFSGTRGMYIENDVHDALDVYGKTKSLGEVQMENIRHLRCSIIGPEPKQHKFLLDWFLNQPKNAQLKGFLNHQWNGVTTLHFAKLCEGIILENPNLPPLQHVIPSGKISKFELLQLFSQYFHRDDITIIPTETEMPLDRTLTTANNDFNKKLWKTAGYAPPPSVEEMVEELSKFNFRMVMDGIQDD